MQQMTLANGTFEPYRKATRREIFLSEMDRVVPWAELCALIEPVYPKAGICPGRGDPPFRRLSVAALNRARRTDPRNGPDSQPMVTHGVAIPRQQDVAEGSGIRETPRRAVFSCSASVAPLAVRRGSFS